MNFKSIADYKGIHEGETCAIIGNGPFLDTDDLDAIHKAGIASFGLNAVAAIYPRTDWRATYFVGVSTALASSNFEPFVNLAINHAKAAFIWERYVYIKKHYEQTNVVPIKCLHTGDTAPNNAWIDDLTGGVSKWLSCTLSAAQIAAWMGFKRVIYTGMTGVYVSNNGDIPVSHFGGYPGLPDRIKQGEGGPLTEVHKIIADNFNRLGIVGLNVSRKTYISYYPVVTLEEALESN